MIDERDRSRLHDMLSFAKDAIDLLGAADPAALAADKMRRYAVTRAMEIVGKAASQVSETGRAACPDISWSGAIGTRNRLIHAYRGIDPQIMISTVREDFPALIAALERVLGGCSP
ncbi:MAG TPA: HepT-like ribonuclease domain-containing protein [Caulobacteraceae bacterium]|nr:HepT-like ribonuclease domain-containing protein [Caulobacteraceae bacterium]